MSWLRSVLEQGIRHPRRTVAPVVIAPLCVAGWVIDWRNGVLRVQIDPTLERLLPEDDPARDAYDRLRLTFGDPDQLMVGLMIDPVFSAEGLAAVEQATRAVKAIRGVREVTSLAAVPNLLADEEVLGVSSFTRQAATNPESIAEMARQVADNPLYAGALVTADGTWASLLVTLESLDARAFRQTRLDRQIREAAQVPRVQAVELAGAVVIRAATTDALMDALRFIQPVLVALLLGLLWLAFRCLISTLAAAATLAVTVLWTLALQAYLGWAINMVTVIVAPLVVTLGLSYTVHMLSESFVPPDGEPGRHDPLKALERASLPLALCGATTAAGFLALGLSPLPAIREFAVLSAFGVLLAIVLILVFLPAVLGGTARRPMAITPDLRAARVAAPKLSAWVIRHRGMILGGTVVISLVALNGATQIRSGAEYIRNFPADSEIRRDFESLNAAFDGATMVSVYVESFVNDALTQPELIGEIDDLQDWLRQQPEVGSALSYVDYLKVLNQSLNDGDVAYFRLPDSAAAAKQILVFGGSDALKRVIDASHRSAVIDLTVTPALGSKLRIVTLWDLLRLDLGQNPQHTILLVSGLTLRETRLFALTDHLQRLKPEDLLIREGEIARDMFVVVDERFEAWVERQGERKLLSTMSRGSVIGEAGYFGQRRTAHGQAVAEARVLRFNAQDLERMRQRYPRIAATLFRTLNRIQAARIARMTAMVR